MAGIEFITGSPYVEYATSKPNPLDSTLTLYAEKPESLQSLSLHTLKRRELMTSGETLSFQTDNVSWENSSMKKEFSEP